MISLFSSSVEPASRRLDLAEWVEHDNSATKTSKMQINDLQEATKAKELGMKGILTAVVILLFSTGGAYAIYPPDFNNNHNSSSSNHSDISPSRGETHRHLVKRKRTHFLHRKELRGIPRIAPESVGGLVTVPTAAGISITVASNVANQFQGFIKDLVDAGYTPRQIHCWAPKGTHVPNSNHYHGGACDFDQGRRNGTASQMYHVGDTAAKWGLRDGCTFRHRDCGHIDDGVNIHWDHPHNLIARYIDYANTPIPKPKASLPPFEE